MVERIDIERALVDIVSNEEGMRFQNLAVVLAKLRWPELIACERHKDRGLDAYASPTLSPDGKGKGLACSTTATFAKIDSDAKAAKEHYERISVMIFATPEKVTKQTEEPWRNEILSRYELELIVMSREEIITTLQLPDNAGICRSHLMLAIPYEPPIADLLRQVREAAATVTAERVAHPRLAGQPHISLNVVLVDERGDETAERFPAGNLRTLLLQGRRVVLEAPAGRGKTTTLVQLAQASAQTEGIPILIDLPAWVRSRNEILDFTAQHPAFRGRGITGDNLARLASAHPYLFLLNGWNEIAEVHADDALTALAALESAFPAAGIIVATRAHHILPPLPGSLRLHLLPLTARQRTQFLGEALTSEQARMLQAKLVADSVLDDVTRTPFILSEVTNLFRAGREIPRTKLGLLAAVVRLNEQMEHHRGALETQPLAGRAAHYLQGLAMALTGRGDVLLGDAEARTICSTASEELRVRGQIAATPEPSLILATLASHHVLERVDYPVVSFRFEHQQFQEYYAAVALRDTLLTIIESGDPSQRDAFARSYLNVPAWEDALEMLAEDLGDGDRDVAIGRALIQGALLIDPVFAARLARLSGAHVWIEVRAVLHHRLRSLYASPDAYHQECAVAAMLATGSEEFADVIVPRVTSADQQIRHATYSAGPDFFPSSIGLQWQTVVASWPEQQRIEFMSQLTIRRQRLEIASTLARTDPSAAVRVEAIRLLAWMRQRDEVADLLRSLSDSEFAQAVEQDDLDELQPELRARALAIYAARLAEADDPKVRLQFALTLSEHGDPDGATRLKHELTNLPDALVRELSNFWLHRAVDAARRRDAPWVSEWVARRIVDGALWQDTWLPFVSEVPQSLRDELFQRAATEEIQQGGAVRVLAATADAALARRAFEALRDQRRALNADPRNEREQALERQLEALVRAIPVRLLVDGLAELLADDPRDEDVDIVLGIFGESRNGDEADSALTYAAREQVRRYLKAAVAAVLAREDFRGEAKAYLASALAEVGCSDDMDDLLALLRADIERVRNGRRMRRDDQRTAQSEGAMMDYAHYHVQAIVRLDPVRAEPILCELLAEPEYELDAAWALREIAKKEQSRRRTIEGRFFGGRGPDYRNVLRMPPEWLLLFDAGRRVKYAGAIRDRITHLLEESRREADTTRANHWRAKELVKALAALDPHGSADLILEVASLPLNIHGSTPIGLLEALVFGGVTLPADHVMALIEPVVQRLRAHGTYNNSAGLVRNLACVLSFVDPPARGVARVRELLAEFPLAPYEQRDLLTALGQCQDEDALALLCEIAREDGAQFQHVARDWLTAVAASPFPRARQLLLSFVDPDVQHGVNDIGLPDDAVSVLADLLADLARHDRTIAARIFDLSTRVGFTRGRVVLAKVCAHIGTPESLLAGLNLIEDAAVPPIPYDLFEAVEGVFLEKRPSTQFANAYSLVPRAASDVRARLFEMAAHDPRRSRSAFSLLARIDAWRLEHGRPPSEPRHPAYDSGMSWPLSVA